MIFNEWKSIQEYVDSIADDIKVETPELSGDLKNSISLNVVPSSEGARIEIDMLYYGHFVDKGVNGVEVDWGSPYSFTKKIPPASAFASYTSNLSKQFEAAAAVYKNGIEPRNFIQPVIDRRIQGLSDLIADSIFNNFFNQIDGKETKIRIW